MPRLSYSKRAAIRQAIDMQKLCFTGAQLLDQDMRSSSDKEERARLATAVGALVRNWSVLQDSVRVLKGDPMPGSLRPDKHPRRRQTPRPGWINPVPIEAAAEAPCPADPQPAEP